MKQDWTEKISQRLNTYEKEVQKDLWEAILQQVAARQHRARVVALYRWIAIAACVLLLIGGWVVFTYDKPDGLSPLKPVASASQQKRPVATEADSLCEPAVSPAIQHASGRTVQQNTLADHLTAHLGQSVTILEDEETNVQTNTPRNERPLPESPSAVTVHGENVESLPDSKPRNRHRLPSLSLRGQNLLAQNPTTDHEPMLLARRAMPARVPDGETFYMSDHSIDTSHSLPLTVGLSLQYSLGSRLWFETGLSYTYLSSSFVYRSLSHVSTDVQRLHYLGIPLQMGYDLWHDRHLTVYGSAGLQADFCVKSTMTTNSEQRNFTRDRVQFSFGADMGLSYEVVRRLSLYAQPSLRYYPDNGNRVENIFTDHPLQLSFQLGVRYKLDNN